MNAKNETTKSKHNLKRFSPGLMLLLHYLTLSIFTMIYFGLIHGRLPQNRKNDPSTAKAIGFLFIPIFNFYWLFFSYLRVRIRINEQLEFRGLNHRLSRGFTLTLCIIAMIPYVNFLALLILEPIFAYKIIKRSNMIIAHDLKPYDTIEEHDTPIVPPPPDDEWDYTSPPPQEKDFNLISTYKEYLEGMQLKPISSSISSSIPNYMISHKIGSGGFATVYMAKDEYGKNVAIKMPKFLDGTLDSSVYDKFKSEAELWTNLKHPNIVEVYGSGLDPLPFIVMGLMEGGDLKQLMSRYSLTHGEATEIMLPIIDAVSYAHRMASVHRDLKLENILFTSDGIPKISDWGIGKFMASESATKTVGTKGTLLYSAPEQISKKKFGKVDWSTDIFQLGIVFYEMLTNVNPFYDEDSAGIVGNILYEKVEAPSTINPQIPHELDLIVLKALEKRKEDRWRSADVMYHELKKASRK